MAGRIAILILVCAAVVLGQHIIGGSGGGGGSPAGTVMAPDVYANLPAASTDGRLFPCTDCYWSLIRDNGTAWEFFRNGVQMTPPPTAGWTDLGTITLTTVGGGRFLDVAPNAAIALEGQHRAEPTAPYVIKTSVLIDEIGSGLFNGIGMMWREAATSEIVTCWAFVEAANDFRYRVDHYTNETTFSINAGKLRSGFIGNGTELHVWIEDNNTNRICRIGTDPNNMLEVLSESNTNFLTADQVGFVGDSQNANYGPEFALMNWTEE